MFIGFLFTCSTDFLETKYCEKYYNMLPMLRLVLCKANTRVIFYHPSIKRTSAHLELYILTHFTELYGMVLTKCLLTWHHHSIYVTGNLCNQALRIMTEHFSHFLKCLNSLAISRNA